MFKPVVEPGFSPDGSRRQLSLWRTLSAGTMLSLMNIMSQALPSLAVMGLLLSPAATLHADTPYATAQSVIDAKHRSEVFWIKGIGTPEKITTWTYYFYDPSVAGKTRMVTVVDGKIDRVQPGEFKTAPTEALFFDPKSTATGDAALAAVKTHAEKAKITCDKVKLQLRRNATGEPPAWRAELYQGDRFAGTVYLKENGSVARYDPDKPAAQPASADKFFKDVETTFKGIGGDLEQFFTGERTVDQ